MNIEDLFNTYKSSIKGISQHEVAERQQQYGRNVITQQHTDTLFMLIGKELFSGFSLLLLGACLLSLYAHFMDDTQGYNFIVYALLFVVFMNTGVSVYQHHKVNSILHSFHAYVPAFVIVTRQGQKQHISAQELVVGDIIHLQEGDKIPADAYVIHQTQLQVDESILTGESGYIAKTEYASCTDDAGLSLCTLYSGTTVVKGIAQALVVAVGSSTKLGAITHLTSDTKQALSPMQQEIRRFAQKITWFALSVGLLFFLLGTFVLENSFYTNIIFAIGIIVANVPEGLLPTVTLSLTQASARMAKQRAIVKNLESVETLGSCTVICTDKTGTLTQNNMQVQQVYMNNTLHTDKNELYINAAYPTFIEIATLCSDVSIVTDKHGTHYYGDPTETAIIDFASELIDVVALQQKFRLCVEKPFTSQDQFMSKVYVSEGNTLYATLKGAPEVILQKCTHIHLDGNVEPLHDSSHIVAVQQGMHKQGLRVLALAYYVGEQNHQEPQGLVFVGLIGLMDPPRPEVAGAVAQCHDAGIKVIVVSGDHAQTVGAVAQKVGITQTPQILTGDMLAQLNDEQALVMLEEPNVVCARIAPEQKLRIVTLLKQAGHVVAVTGDGVNDAPALKAAHIGVSMGKSGTDVAKDASDIILLDDNFATIVKAIKEGRTIFDNIQRFITYSLTSN
ncbi:MAG: cation-translocating P-type ATPase, partial [Candidatus Woesearchaeota archaeon]